MRQASKSSLYRNEVTEAAVACMLETLARMRRGERPTPQDDSRSELRGRPWPALRQPDRAIDWNRDDTATVLRKIRASDGAPGVLDAIAGVAMLPVRRPSRGCAAGRPGAVVATRDSAICRATRDGAVWITHLKRADDPHAFKLPALRALGGLLEGIPESPLPIDARVAGPTWREIRYEEAGARRLAATSRSTTAPWAPRSARRFDVRTPTRVRDRRA